MKTALTIVFAIGFLAVALAGTSAAQARKVLVLPVDGTAPAEQRTSINDAVIKLAKDGIDGDVTAGDTTFNETATAVGCSADQPGCADTVMTTLSVDELVWGDAKTENGSTTVTVHRAAKGEPARQQIVVIDEKGNGDAVTSGMGPLFSRDAGAGSGSAVPPTPRTHTKSFFDTTERKLAVGFAAGSVLALAVGFSFWNGESGLQDQIDNHRMDTRADFTALTDLEDRAASKALWGNVFVVVGVGLGAASGYYFWKDHKNRGDATVIAPAPTPDGQGVKMVLGGRW